MGKIKKSSLKWSFAKYIIPCVVMSMLGILIIGHGTNYLQEWYLSTHSSPADSEVTKFEITFHDDIIHYYSRLGNKTESIIYIIISNAQVLLIPLWALFCIGITGFIFYNMELKRPLEILLNASKKISENQLDFTIEYGKPNELGQLCNAFDDMRKALDGNNREIWRSLEERKRLNSAFSHDLRTPLTVLKGYNDFLVKYIDFVNST